MIPTLEECIKLLEKYGTRQDSGVFKHSKKVTDIAVFLAKKKIEAGETIDLKLIQAGAMLHDIRKYDEIEARKNGNNAFFHHYEGAVTVEQEGYPELKGIVINHFWLCIPMACIEDKIVSYADKRVNGDTIVLLKERYADLMQRYPHLKNELETDLQKGLVVETELFAKLSITPDELGKLVA